MKLPLCAISGFLMLCLPANAANVVGSAVIDGKDAALMSDGSWHYTRDAGTICHDLGVGFGLCVNGADWHPIPPDRLDQRAVFRHDDAFETRIAVWRVGSSTEITPKRIDRVIESWSKDGNLRAPVLERYESKIFDQTAETVVTVNGGFVRAFTSMVFPDKTIVVETSKYDGTLYHNDHRALHDLVLTGLRNSP